MRARVLSVVASSIVFVLGLVPVRAADLGRETLAPGDGWAAYSAGTTGGAAADEDHVFTVTNRNELVAALNNRDATPKIIYVLGTIDANVDDDNVPLSCADYQRGGYTLEGYLAAYDPATWGRVLPSGPMETARLASHAAQEARVRIRIGSNTTIVGYDENAVVRGAWFELRDATNVIIRNITFHDTFDCFPQWDPTDGSQGNWNSSYDSISVRNNSTHVWIDHNVFEDHDTVDEGLPYHFGRLFQVHDGQTDITNAADFVTVSWNVYRHHDKVMLIGSSDSGSTANGDRGKLRTTVHHNLFEDVNQRAPRVRFGQVHVYNNYYKLKHGTRYGYSWGVGVESMIYAENNFFWTDGTQTPDEFIEVYKGKAIHVEGTLVDGPADKRSVDVLAAFNEANDPDLSGDVGWTPTLHLEIDRTRHVLPAVRSHAGVFDPFEED